MPPSEKKWDANAERDLCVAIIMGAQDAERMRYNWPKVHGSMEALGYSFTKDAISQHFSKSIMRDFKGRHGDFSTSTPATPRKATPRKRATPAKGRKKKIEILDDDDDDDAETMAGSPVPKKVRRKMEDEDEDCKTSDDAQDKSEGSLPAVEKDAKFEDWLTKGDGA
ncbi:hypothetical protein FBEOM_2000 [Fusarium beomiforme]|uniref:Uncharacterized protein n=1 Tax=Fusarium beomiforme TaxID=44412 RepID=A0A9P5AS91_9HYPO|nr:hypothetical protein FBEOM_2000 [Fusarium beomiforme]